METNNKANNKTDLNKVTKKTDIQQVWFTHDLFKTIINKTINVFFPL